MGQLKYHRGFYWWKGTFEQRALPMAHGFNWHEKTNLWRTDRPEKATNLLSYADDKTKILCEKAVRHAEYTVGLSRATSSDNIFLAPKGLKFFPYQNAGIEFITSRNNTMLADEMGLGKTIQAIGAINEWPNIRRGLIICPASVKLNWEREIETWCTKYLEIHGARGRSDKRAKAEGFEILILNYALLQYYQPLLMQTKWDFKIVDEFHYLMHVDAIRTQIALSIQTPKSIFLSGTPGEKPIEIRPSLRHLDPAHWNEHWPYAKKFCNPRRTVAEGKQKATWDLSGAENLEELQYLLRSSIMIRRLKSQVLPDLPPKQRCVIPLPANKLETYLMYEKVFIRKLIGKQISNKPLTQQDYDKAVAILSTDKVDMDENMAAVRRRLGVAKVPFIIDYLDTCLQNVKKVLCYAYHRDVIKALQEHYGNKCVVVMGGVTSQNREKAMKRFGEDDECQLYIGQITAMGTGTEGLQKITNVGVFAEMEWTFKQMEQAEDRIHRIKQKMSALYYYLVIDGSIDSYMAKKLQSRKQVSVAMFDKETVRYQNQIDIFKNLN